MGEKRVKLNQKLKLLYVAAFLLRESDEEHPVSVERILLYLENHGIICERKSLYNDVAVLKDFGVDILYTKVPSSGYFVASRDFEEAEVRLLCDAVQAAGFISAKKSNQLCEKILQLLSTAQASEIRGQVYIENRTKSSNEEIYYTVDKLNRAIRRGKKVSLIYRRRVVAEHNQVAFEDRTHIVSPYGMIWRDDHYYLAANNEKYDNVMVLRVDRIRALEILESEPVRPFSEVTPYKSYFDTADYAKTHFNMFSGTPERIELLCKAEMLEIVLDRFGEDARIVQTGHEKFKLFTDAAVSDGLVAWILQFGGKIQVLKPDSLRTSVVHKAEEVLRQYKI